MPELNDVNEAVSKAEAQDETCSECGDTLDENGDCLNSECTDSPYFIDDEEDDELPDSDD